MAYRERNGSFLRIESPNFHRVLFCEQFIKKLKFVKRRTSTALFRAVEHDVFGAVAGRQPDAHESKQIELLSSNVRG